MVTGFEVVRIREEQVVPVLPPEPLPVIPTEDIKTEEEGHDEEIQE
jgi:hypothetical protein